MLSLRKTSLVPAPTPLSRLRDFHSIDSAQTPGKTVALAPKELNDSKMYHKGKGIPYFPVLSFYPHESGVDVTFENKEKGFRASFLIRKYEYRYNNPNETGVADNPRDLVPGLHAYPDD